MRTFGHHHRRRGFTLVEVLVAAALCILIMTMLTYAFQQGMDTFSHLKSTGEMQERLRAAEIVLREDLKADHLDTDLGAKVGDQRPDLVGTTGNTWQPPRGGFFRLLQEGASRQEGGTLVDNDNLPSTVATNHILHFTVRRPADREDRLFTTPMRPTQAAYQSLYNAGVAGFMPAPTTLTFPLTQDVQFASDWAEVCYFLDTQNQTGTTAGSSYTGSVSWSTSQPLYTLYRRVRVIARKPVTLTPPNAPEIGGASYRAGFSVNQFRSAINDPAAAANPINRLGGKGSRRTPLSAPPPVQDPVAANKASTPAAPPIGDDLLLTNVLSFEARLIFDGATTFSGGNLHYPALDVISVPGYPMQNNDNTAFGGKGVFDTWYKDAAGNWAASNNADSLPLRVRARAVQIKLRVYDLKNKLTRQTTIIQEI